MAQEPAVVTEDVRRILQQVIRPGDPDEGEAVSRVAERAEVSTRTVYRVMNPPAKHPGNTPTISLALADRLVVAAGRQLAEINCRVVVDGRLLSYRDC